MKKRVKGWMICSYFCVLAIFILIYLAIQHQTEKKIRELYMDRQLAVMNQTMLAVDEQVEAVTKLCLKIIQEPYVQYFPFVGTQLDRYDRENAAKLLQIVRKHYTDDPFVEDFYLFYENSGRIAHANGFYLEETFYQMEWAYEEPALQQRARGLMRKGGIFFLPAAWMVNGSKRTENITLFYPIGKDKGDRSGKAAKLVVLLKKSWLDDMIVPLSENGRVNILGAWDGEELYCSSHGDLLKELTVDPGWEGKEGSGAGQDGKGGIVSWNGQRYLLTRLDSEKTGWIYESVIPYSLITDQMKEAVSPMSAGLLIYLLIGIPACILLAVWNYTPIRQLTTHMEDIGFGEEAGNRDEIDFIRSGIADLHKKYKELESKYDSTRQEFDSATRKLKKNRERLQEGVLLQLIGGYWKDGQEIEERLKSLGIEFPYGRFCMAIIQTEDPKAENEVLDAEEKALRLFILKNVAQEFLEPMGLAIPVPIDPRRLFLVMDLSEAGYEGERVSLELEQLLEKMKGYFLRELKLVISVGVGTLCSEIRQLHISARRSERALEYCFILGKASLVIYDRIAQEGKGAFSYQVSIEKPLFSSMLQRDADACSHLLDALYEDISEQKISVEEGKRLHMLLADIAMRAIERSNVRAGEDELCQDMVATILSSQTLPEAFPMLKELFATLCQEKEENGKERELERQVMKAIEAHFSDPAFSLPMCADYFGVSPEHLSRTIKLVTGRNFVDIVNSLRLDQAKWYLLETDKKIEEIAGLSGYGTAKSFFRSFKQAEGVPPGVWRKEHKGG